MNKQPKKEYNYRGNYDNKKNFIEFNIKNIKNIENQNYNQRFKQQAYIEIKVKICHIPNLSDYFLYIMSNSL